MKIYLPLLYSERIKRPNKKYFLRTILCEDFLILLLSFAYHSIYFWQTSITLFLLQISFWCIYELGYIENDIIGEKFEDEPVLSCNYNSNKYSLYSWQPWAWSFILSTISIFFIQRLDINRTINLIPFTQNSNWLVNIIESCFSWMAFLVILKLIFSIYNHLNKQSRVWFYSLLQVCRYCGYLILFTVNTIGLMLLISIAMSRWIQYIVYRYVLGKGIKLPMYFPRYFFCFIIFILLTAIIAINERDLSLVLNYQLFAISGFCFVRGYKHFKKVFSEFILVSKNGSNYIN